MVQIDLQPFSFSSSAKLPLWMLLLICLAPWPQLICFWKIQNSKARQTTESVVSLRESRNKRAREGCSHKYSWSQS